MVLGVLLWGMFAAARIVRKEEQLLKPLATPGEHTVMLSGLPTYPRPHRKALIDSFSTYGEVTHAVVALPIRHVLLRMPERSRLLQQLLTARIQLFLHGRSGEPTTGFGRGCCRARRHACLPARAVPLAATHRAQSHRPVPRVTPLRAARPLRPRGDAGPGLLRHRDGQ